MSPSPRYHQHSGQLESLLGRVALGGLAAGLIGVAFVVAAPICHSVQIGGDEHYELTKGLLWSKGFLLYQQVWNDQPPLFTVLLGVSLKLFGATVAPARVLAAAFGLSLIGGCVWLVSRRSGTLAGAMAAIALLLSPQVLPLGVSVMLEVPAMATALWALWPVIHWQKDARWLAASGAILAAALQIKLTAAVAAPALAFEILLTRRGQKGRDWARTAAKALGVWCTSLAITYGLLGLMFGFVPREVMWAAHFSAEMKESAVGLL